MKDDLKFFFMKDDLNFSRNGRQPHLSKKWKTTWIHQEMENNLSFPRNGGCPHFFKSNGRWHKFSRKMEDDIYLLILVEDELCTIGNTRRPNGEYIVIHQTISEFIRIYWYPSVYILNPLDGLTPFNSF